MLLVILTLLIWGKVPWGRFQFDDFINVVRDPATTDIATLLQRLLQGLRPLTRLSFFLDAQLFGMRAGGFLGTNLLLHLCTVLLVFLLAQRRTDDRGAFLAALLFSLQPANAEVVAYVSGRSTGLMTLFLLGGLLLNDRGRRTGALVMFMMACFAKEVAIVFPAFIFVWEMTREEHRPNLRREMIGWFCVSFVFFAIFLCLANYRSLISYSLEMRSLWVNILANARAIPETLSLLVRPWALSADHEFDPSVHVAASIAGFLLIACSVLAANSLQHRLPLLSLGLAWPIIALLPTNSIIPKIDLVTEKPLYLAWIGPSLAIGAAVSSLMRSAVSRRARYILVGAAIILMCGLAGAAMWRASLWRHPTLLWLDATAKAPAKSRCWNNLGMAYLTENRDVEAVSAFERAIALDSRNEIARFNLTTAKVLCGSRCSP